MERLLLGAYLIVKNEEEQILDCLNSILPICDEIVIVDTGCDDRTMELVNSLNSPKISTYNYKWTNDFGAARNFALTKTTAKYTFTTDADEIFSDGLRNEILRLKELDFSGMTCIDMFILNKDNIKGDSLYLGGRQIVLNDGKCLWKYKIHEKLYFDESKPYVIPHEIGIIIHNKKTGVASSNYNKYAESYFNDINSGDVSVDKLAHYYYYLFFTLKGIDRLDGLQYLSGLYNANNIISKSEDQRFTLYTDNYISFEEFYALSLIGAHSDPKLLLNAARVWPDSQYAEYISLKYAYSRIGMLKRNEDIIDTFIRFAYSSYMIGRVSEYISIVKRFLSWFPSNSVAINDKSFIDSYITPFRKKYKLVIECDNINTLPSSVCTWSQYFDDVILITDKREEILSSVSLAPFESFYFVNSPLDIRGDFTMFKVKSSIYFSYADALKLSESLMYGKKEQLSNIELIEPMKE